jgi:predicted regulator of Ras-like GTPase activity (Roadblock/LC7/MglB family)
MTDPFDDAARDLVRRAHEADPDPAGFDPSAGLADVLTRSSANSTTEPQAGASLSSLITDFARRVLGVAHTVVVSADGLLLAGSHGLPQDRAEQLSTLSSGLITLAMGTARSVEGGAIRQTVVEMERGYLVLMSVHGGACLAVLAEPDCDVGLVIYEMILLAKRVGQNLPGANMLLGKAKKPDALSDAP